MNGHLILIMAPSGSGKGVLINHIRETFADTVTFAVSCTTRNPRPGEKDGETYYFKTREEFEALIADGAFLEWEEYGGNLYGTLKEELLRPLREGKLVLYELDIRGVQSLSEIIDRKNISVLFIDAGEWKVLEKRIRDRAPISEAELEQRRIRYEEEYRSKDVADIILPNPDGELEETKQKLAEIIETKYNTLA